MKALGIGDVLYSPGSWNDETTTVVSVTETEAITGNGLRFKRQFDDGDMPVDHRIVSMEYNNWYLKQ